MFGQNAPRVWPVSYTHLMNPAAEMLLAVSGQRSHGQFISELFTESPEALNSLRQAVEQAHPFTKREATLTSITGVSITGDYAVTVSYTHLTLVCPSLSR